MSTKYSTAGETGEAAFAEATETKRYAGEAERAYEDLFVRWSDRGERLIRLALLGLIALLIGSQALLHWPLFREAVVKVERLEGRPYPESQR